MTNPGLDADTEQSAEPGRKEYACSEKHGRIWRQCPRM